MYNLNLVFDCISEPHVNVKHIKLCKRNLLAMSIQYNALPFVETMPVIKKRYIVEVWQVSEQITMT